MTTDNIDKKGQVDDKMTKVYHIGRFISNSTEALMTGFAPFFLTLLEVFIAYNEANVIATLQPMNKSAFYEALAVTFIGMFAGIMFPSQISQAWQLNRHIKMAPNASNNVEFNNEFIHRLKAGRFRFLVVGIGSFVTAVACHVMTVYFVTIAAQSEDILNIIMLKAQQETGLVYQFTDSFGIAQGIITLSYLLAVVAFVLDILLGSITAVEVDVSQYYPREASDKLKAIKVAESYLEDSIQRIKLLEDTVKKLSELEKRNILLNTKLTVFENHRKEMEELATGAAEDQYQQEIKNFIPKTTKQGDLFNKGNQAPPADKDGKRASTNEKALEVQKSNALDKFRKKDSGLGKDKAAESSKDMFLSGDMDIDIESINSKAVGDLVAEFYKRYDVTVEKYQEVMSDLDARNNEQLMLEFTSKFRDQMELWKRIKTKDIGAPEDSKEYKETLTAMVSSYDKMKEKVVDCMKKMGFKMEHIGE